MRDAQRQVEQAQVAERVGREAARQGELAGRQAQRQAALAASHAHLAELSVDSPEFSAEVRALASSAARLGTEYAHLSEAQRDALREEMQRHQERLREIAEQAHEQSESADPDSDN